jgi:hypothetical protein
MKDRRLGWSDEDLASLPYAHHWNPRLSALGDRARRALEDGPLAPPLLPGLEAGGALFEEGPSGYALCPDGELRVAIDTDLPGVTPAMVDWWFGWHGDDARKYKLWHPGAHVHVAWRAPPPDEARGRARYVGFTSIVDEYIGSRRVQGAIGFVEPASLGFRADDTAATAVCARTGLADAPVDVGWLAHIVRRTQAGSRMRSLFWLGGRHIAGRNLPGRAMAALARRTLRLGEPQARALLVHCAQEMQHLGGFLPALHAQIEGR